MKPRRQDAKVAKKNPPMTEADTDSPASRTSRRPSRVRGPLLEVARDIKLSHSVFALPFAVLAMFLAAASDLPPRLPRVGEAVLIVLCMVLARTVAMAINRLADARLDARNPRTAGRAIPAGRVSRGFMLGVAAACALGFVAAAGGFWWWYGNAWPVLLSPLVLAWLCGYSFTKRFTWLCHLWLGAALALSPVAASIAIRPAYLAEAGPWLLAGFVACWVAGFDVIYSLQDVAVDRAQGLRSMPARFGPAGALWGARGLHVAAAAAVIALAWAEPRLGWPFAAAGAGVVVLLVVEHALVRGGDTRRLPLAFLTVNGVISLVLGAVGGGRRDGRVKAQLSIHADAERVERGVSQALVKARTRRFARRLAQRRRGDGGVRNEGGGRLSSAP